MQELTDQQLLRYSRQIMLPNIDVEGQERICAARVLIIGLGGLGCPVALYLAAAGVGELVLVDDDQVELSNLQRQVLHTEARVGETKVASAAQALREINSQVRIHTRAERLTTEALQAEVAKAQVVVDCSDNFTTRFALNAACMAAGTPLVSGAAIRMEGQVSVFLAKAGEPCYQCLYKIGDDEQLSCSESGVLAPVVGLIGSVQATETLKILAGQGASLAGHLLLLDANTMDWRKLKLRRDPACPVCSTHHIQPDNE
ncbi:HesA/MoeB/ThiF family protein [Balneatrix alpica]|uniref:HesA/MoeB/ThiF family protein n=1 Tax=Balneatrix alpica TaxID=75684 RepID=UPI002738E21E|nr:molybdopterin-synthase adenylyltransferase MoeB [Balneatrix alpica]